MELIKAIVKVLGLVVGFCGLVAVYFAFLFVSMPLFLLGLFWILAGAISVTMNERPNQIKGV